MNYLEKLKELQSELLKLNKDVNSSFNDNLKLEIENQELKEKLKDSEENREILRIQLRTANKLNDQLNKYIKDVTTKLDDALKEIND